MSKLKKTLTSEDPQFEVLRQFASNDEIIIYSMGKRIRDEKLEWLGIKDRFEGSYLETSDSINFD